MITLAEVQDALKNGCEIVLDYGTSPYANPHGIGSTIIERPGWRVLRWGGCFEAQAALVRKHFGVELPPRPTEGPLNPALRVAAETRELGEVAV